MDEKMSDSSDEFELEQALALALARGKTKGFNAFRDGLDPDSDQFVYQSPKRKRRVVFVPEVSESLASASQKKAVERPRKARSDRLLRPSLVSKRSGQPQASARPKHRVALSFDSGTHMSDDDVFGISSRKAPKRKKRKGKRRVVLKPGESLVKLLQETEECLDYKRVAAIVERYPAEIGKRDKRKNNALHLAAVRSDPRLLGVLLRKANQRHLSAINDCLETPLLVSVRSAANMSCVSQLLKRTKDWKSISHFKNWKGRTALTKAAHSGATDVVLLLVAVRPVIDLEVADKSLCKPLYYALKNSNVKMSIALISSGALLTRVRRYEDAADVASGRCVELVANTEYCLFLMIVATSGFVQTTGAQPSVVKLLADFVFGSYKQ